MARNNPLDPKHKTAVNGNDLCDECRGVEKRYCKKSKERDLFVFHTTRGTLTANKANLSEKKKCRQRIEKHVAALRNTDGGEILIHIEGQEEGDRCLEFFDEFVTKRFCELISDGSTFVDNYVRYWLSDLEDFSEDKHFLLLKVSKSSGVVTVDFNTKLRHDHEIVDPSTINIVNFLSQGTVKSPPRLKFREVQNNLYLLQEGRNTEVKSFWPNKDKLKKDGSYLSGLVDYIWNDLKLRDSVTSMSKISSGGSYFVGIKETNVSGVSYKTKKLDVTGFELKVNPEELKSALYKKLESNIVIYRNKVFLTTIKDIIDVELYEIDSVNRKYVLEVAIGCTDGIVFSDADGPRTYYIQDGEVCRMNKEEWLNRINENCFMCNRKL